jgi:hypothetical protein
MGLVSRVSVLYSHPVRVEQLAPGFLGLTATSLPAVLEQKQTEAAAQTCPPQVCSQAHLEKHRVNSKPFPLQRRPPLFTAAGPRSKGW